MRALCRCAVLGLVLVSACGGAGASGAGGGTQAAGPSEATAPATAPAEQAHPDVVEAVLTPDGDRWAVEVTISSPYDTPDRYADGWRVLAPDGTVLGEHELTHDHAGEQPFTRTQRGLEIPEGIDEVVVEGRDLRNGYGGATVTVEVAA